MIRRVVICVLLVVAVGRGVALPLSAYAQGGGAPRPLTWDDAPLVPLHRSQADWLVEVGWKAYADVFGPFITHPYQVGDREEFFPLGGVGLDETFRLVYRSEHAYFWFERQMPVDMAELEATVEFFEGVIWPLNHAIYGEEWKPGIDGDDRLHIINQAFIGPHVIGAFNPDDQCPRSVCPESNQREAIYINLALAPLNSQDYLTTLAHEYQHLIQYHVDGNESRWLNEGLSQLAEHFSGFHPRYVGGSNLRDFLTEPDHDLDGWAVDEFETGRYYGASYLFLLYLYERFGLDFIKALAADPYDGLAGVQHGLRLAGQGETVDTVFADWIIANYLDDPYAADGRYYYQSLDLPLRLRPVRLGLLDREKQYTDTVHQYGADYVLLDVPGTYELQFDGSDMAQITGAEPYSGEWMWWSGDGISSAARLTGAFDLSGLDQAALVFNAWWDIEQDYDWFQVLVSTDGGQSWQITGGSQARRGNDLAPGAFYSGRSGRWVREQIDLTPFTGGPVLIRFEYLTDSSHSLGGLLLDDLAIVEIGYADDTESPASVWHAEGFLRVPAQVSQHWTVALVEQVPGQDPAVRRLALDAQQTGQTTLTVPQGGSITLVVGAMAPFTPARAAYQFTLRPLDVGG